MAPECHKTGKHTQYYSGRRADIWALGLCIFILAFNELPYDASLGRDKIQKATLELDITAKISERRSVRKLSPRLEDMLEKMLAKNPQDRWTAEQLRKHPFVSRRLL